MARVTRAFPPAPSAATPVPPPPRPGEAFVWRRRAALAAAVLVAVATAHLAADHEASARFAAADPELANLLRAMALIKGGMAAAAVWLADRLLLRLPALGAGLAACLVLAVSLMAAAPVLMWHVAHVGTGALLFHGGMALLLALGWRPAGAWPATERRSRR